MKILPGDVLLLCSDGLTDLVDDHEILEVIQTQPNDQAVNALVDLANERGGHDNITIITLEMPEFGLKTFKLKRGEDGKMGEPLGVDLDHQRPGDCTRCIGHTAFPVCNLSPRHGSFNNPHNGNP